MLERNKNRCWWNHSRPDAAWHDLALVYKNRRGFISRITQSGSYKSIVSNTYFRFIVTHCAFQLITSLGYILSKRCSGSWKLDTWQVYLGELKSWSQAWRLSDRIWINNSDHRRILTEHFMTSQVIKQHISHSQEQIYKAVSCMSMCSMNECY